MNRKLFDLKYLILDDGGIYKGRSSQRQRAREIDETGDTKVDLPVDYREVETVEVSYQVYLLNFIIFSFEF